MAHKLIPVKFSNQPVLAPLLLSLTLLAGCVAEAQSAKPNSGKNRSVPVLIATASQKTVPITVQQTGTVEAYSTVSIKSQIGGQLTDVYFQEGQNVKKGDLLFKIDSRTQQSGLLEAQANRAKATTGTETAVANREKALADVSQAEANRAKALAGVSQAKANLEKAQSAISQAEANKLKAEAAVSQAKANAAKDEAQARNAAQRAERYSSLYAEGAISEEQIEQYRTEAAAQAATSNASQSSISQAEAAVSAAQGDIQNAKAAADAAAAEVENAQAAVKAADAQVENAQAAVKAADAQIKNSQAAVEAVDAEVQNANLQLSYSTIVSPIDGRTGTLNVNRGNLVKENDTNPLVVISQIHPIYVTFTIPQNILPDVQKYMAKNGSLDVEAFVSKNDKEPEKGQLVFVDSAVDKTTGTVKLKASFSNTDERLTPGQFVNVLLKLAQESNTLTVPTVAVQTGQEGQFVFVVKADNTVEIRKVKAGRTVGSETVITSGLNPGETVVTDGQFNLVAGAKVQIKENLDSGGNQAPNKSKHSKSSS